MKEWVKMPTAWITESKKLHELKWVGDSASDNTAALMLYIIFLQNANPEPKITGDEGVTQLTYAQISQLIGMSRSKISAGTKVLEKLGLIEKSKRGRAMDYQIQGYIYGKGYQWGKMPARGLYSKDFQRMPALHSFKLRSKHELNALKIYLLIICFRDNRENITRISYDKISEYTGILRSDIRSAISLLVNQGMVHVDNQPSEKDPSMNMNIYRLSFLEPYKHRGTSLRKNL